MLNIGYPEKPIVGKQAFVTRRRRFLEPICERFGRDIEGMCLKVFYGNPMTSKQELKYALWGDDPPENEPRKNTTVWAGSQVQNILWRYGIAPRVYAIFEAKYRGQRVACQLTDFCTEPYPKDIAEIYELHAKIQLIGEDYGFKAQSTKMGKKDMRGNKCIDPQLWAFDDKPYEETVKTIYNEKGKYGKIYYQNDPKLGCTGGPRQSLDRIKYMQLDKIDFKGKTVWDIGCAGGFFCRYAMDRGAKRVIGLDETKPLEAAFHAGNLLGYFNIDYQDCDLRRGVPVAEIPKADIAFFLSMNYHIEIPEGLLKNVDTVIFEDNGRASREKDKLESPWIDYYKNIEFVGRGKDHGDKACYHLRRK